MVTGGKRHFSMSSGGKWFAHPVLPENETRSREACTSTGIMLTRVKSSLPQALNFERYPKWKTQQVCMCTVDSSVSGFGTVASSCEKSREYPFSDHNNKHALKDDISVFSQGVGRRKCPDDQRRNSSHFSMCHDGAYSSHEETGGNITVHQTDFTVKQAVNVPTSARRFSRNHQQKAAALAQVGEKFMWFGRHDSSDFSESLQVLAATNCSAPSKPQVVLQLRH